MARIACQFVGQNVRRCMGLQGSSKQAWLKGNNTPLMERGLLRNLSSQSDANLVLVEKDDASGVGILKLNRKPVNSLSLELLTELHLAIEKLEGDKSCKGVILTSANPGVFSAGLDILEMYQPDETRLREFWRSLQEVYLRLYGSGIITMAAINGHAPAGGCLLSMCCDYRVMASPKFTIGLNETKLGIVPPLWFSDLFINICGQRQAEYCLQLGKMLTSEEALKIGLVDELAPIEDVYSKARAEIEEWLKIPGLARQLTKAGLRNPFLQKLTSRREDDINAFVNFVTKDSVQKVMGMYIESLKSRKG